MTNETMQQAAEGQKEKEKNKTQCSKQLSLRQINYSTRYTIFWQII